MAPGTAAGLGHRSSARDSCGVLGHNVAASERAMRNPGTLKASGSLVVQNAEPCYNSLLSSKRIIMLEYTQRLDNIMLQLQSILDEEYEDNNKIQTAFNNLAIALDEELGV